MSSPALEPAITGHSTIAVAKDKLSADLADEAVVLDLKSGMYYGLDEVGARIWMLIQEPRTVNQVRDALVREYEVDADRCERDLVAFLQELVDQGLVEVRDAAGE
jgi:hypothetical protein